MSCFVLNSYLFAHGILIIVTYVKKIANEKMIFSAPVQGFKKYLIRYCDKCTALLPGDNAFEVRIAYL